MIDTTLLCTVKVKLGKTVLLQQHHQTKCTTNFLDYCNKIQINKWLRTYDESMAENGL